MSKQVITALSFVMFLATVFSRQTPAQELKTISQAHEAKVKRKVVKWTLTDKLLKEQEAEYKFHSGDHFAGVRIQKLASSELAAEQLNLEQSLYPTPPKRIRLTGFGDEAWLYKSGLGKDSRKIVIRLEAYYIRVVGSNLDIAKEFAQDICQVIREGPTQK